MGLYLEAEAPLREALDKRFIELALKYSPQVVLHAWNEVVMAEGSEVEFWPQGKSAITIEEALRLMDDYVDFVETMIQKRQERDTWLLPVKGKTTHPRQG